MARKKKRDAKELTALDEYLDEQRTRGKFEARARLEVHAWQINRPIKAKVLPGPKKKRKSERAAPPS